jgi:16S rRNA (uracil1498-N3)-methyltransferase
MHRFYTAKENISCQEDLRQAVINGEEFKHLSKVLRLYVGDTVTVFDGEGREYEGNIAAIGKEEALVNLEEPLFLPRESPIEILLVQGIPKGEKMEMIIQKATELGVRGIIPLKAERCVVKLEGKKEEERRQRWQKVAAEAAKQCRRALIPEILPACTLEAFLQGLPEEYHLFIPWEEGGSSLKTLLQERECNKEKQIFIMIGPEGGFDEKEVLFVKRRGGIPVTLGPRILRTETAGLAAIAAIMFGWGDLG